MADGMLKLSPELVSIVEALRGGGLVLRGVLVKMMLVPSVSSVVPVVIIMSVELSLLLISIGESEVVGSIGLLNACIIGIVFSYYVVLQLFIWLNEVSIIYVVGITLGGVGGLTEELLVLNIGDLLVEV